MKLIALRAFRNTHGFDLNKDGVISDHEHHIPKGARFDIGGAKPFEELNKAEQRLVAELNTAKCVGDASDTKLVAKIAAEVKAEAAVEERQKNTAMAAGSSADLVKQLTAALAQLSGKAAASAK